MEKVELFSKIEKVIFNNPATIVLFDDGTKSVAKCDGADKYDPFKGYLTALIKHILPSDYNLVKLLKNKKYKGLYFDSGYDKNANNCYTTLYERYGLNSNKICAKIYRGRLNDYNYDIRTRKLLCLLSYFSKDYCDYKHVYIDDMNKLLSSKPKFYSDPKNHANVDFYNIPNSPLYDNHILKLNIDKLNKLHNSISPLNSIHINSSNNPNIYISKVIKETLDDYFKKQTYTVMLDMDSKYLAEMTYNHNAACAHDIDALNNLKMYDFIKKVGEDMAREFKESLNNQSKVNYDMFKIDRSKGYVYNAEVYKSFLVNFNSTGECDGDKCTRHGLLGLLSELGELKEVLTEMLLTLNFSDKMYEHMRKEISDICWMLCEYSTYCDVNLDCYTFSKYIQSATEFHNSNNTDYLRWVGPIGTCCPFSIAIGVVDDMMLNATKITGIHQKILQGHTVGEFKEQHHNIMLDIYINLQYISQYIFDTNFTTLFDIGMKKVKNRYPDGWMDPQRSINRKPEDI